MPRILNGYWCAGVGGGIASVGKLPDLTPRAQWQNAGGSCFLNDRGDVIFQQGAHLERFNVLNGEYQQDFDAQGCFSLAAGGGVYAATFYDGARVSNQGTARYMRYGVGDVSPDGNAILVEPNGTLLGQVFATIQAVEGGGFIALDRNYRPYGGNGAVAPVAVPGRIYGLRVHGDLCIYHAEDGGRLIVQRRDSLTGVVLAAGLVECYRPDFEERDGQIVVLYATKEGEAPGQMVCLKTSRSAFGTLPSVVATLPPQPPIETPKPEPTPVSIPNISARLQAERDKYPGPVTPDQCVAILNDAAYGTGFKLYKKAGGGKQPRTGIECSRDILGYPDPSVGMYYEDVLGASGSGAASVEWPSAWKVSAPGDVGNYIDPVGSAPQPTPQPVPAPQPVPSQPDNTPCTCAADVAQLKADVAALKAWTQGVK